MTHTSPKTSPEPIVATYVERLRTQAEQRNAEAEASKAEKHRATEEQIRGGELAKRLNSRPPEVSQASHHVTASSSSSTPRPSGQGPAEIDGQHKPRPSQPPITPSSSTTTDSRTRELALELADQKAQIQVLETKRNTLTQQVANLRRQRDVKDCKLMEATIARTKARKELREATAALKVQIEGLLEDRSRLEAQIEEAKAKEIALRLDLEEEKAKVSRLEDAQAQREAAVRGDGSVALAAADGRAPSTVGAASSRSASAGESERRRRRSQSSNPLFALTFEVLRDGEKEKEKKKHKKSNSK